MFPLLLTRLVAISLLVPYQDNSWDCGVFVCRYGFAIYMLPDRNVTYAHRNEAVPFGSLITNSEEFNFDGSDIVRIRAELATLLNNLSALYKEWKKADDEAEKKAEEESKKPAVRQLLLTNGDASAEEGQAGSTAELDETSKSFMSLESTAAPAETVEEEEKASSVPEQDETNKVGPSLQSKVLEEETADAMVANDVDMDTADSDKVEDSASEETKETGTPIKMEDDQYVSVAMAVDQLGSEAMEVEESGGEAMEVDENEVAEEVAI